jgi:hypothetical protein
VLGPISRPTTMTSCRPAAKYVCDLSSDSVGSSSDYRDGRHPMRRFSSALCDRSIAFATNAGSSHIGK